MNIIERVFETAKQYSGIKYTADDVRIVLAKATLDFYDLSALLSHSAKDFLEEIAAKAKQNRERFFGNSVHLFTPLYLSNYCENGCTYCGFNKFRDINRKKLSFAEVEAELESLREIGIEDILLLTGESENDAGLEYVAKCVALAKLRFNSVGVEIFPCDESGYEILRQNGADFVSVYQETYNREIYEKVHVCGKKSNFNFRFNSHERALKFGMRGVTLGALFGLADPFIDAFYALAHAYFLQKKYPRAEISLSAPRLRGIAGEVSERDLLHIFAVFRIFMPYAGIVISTRERKIFRDNIIKIAANKMSANVSVAVGGYACNNAGSAQFEVSDKRNLKEIYKDLKSGGMQPVFTDYINV